MASNLCNIYISSNPIAIWTNNIYTNNKNRVDQVVLLVKIIFNFPYIFPFLYQMNCSLNAIWIISASDWTPIRKSGMLSNSFYIAWWLILLLL